MTKSTKNTLNRRPAKCFPGRNVVYSMTTATPKVSFLTILVGRGLEDVCLLNWYFNTFHANIIKYQTSCRCNTSKNDDFPSHFSTSGSSPQLKHGWKNWLPGLNRSFCMEVIWYPYQHVHMDRIKKYSKVCLCNICVYIYILYNDWQESFSSSSESIFEQDWTFE